MNQISNVKILNLEQRSEDWHALRRASIGASDAAVIMGISPWKTIEELWKEKVTGKSKVKTSPAMQRGIDQEPIVRAMVEFEHDKDFPAVVMQHSEHEFMIASLDGWHDESKTVLEIKVPNLKSHLECVQGRCPAIYVPQIQHQLLVSGGERALYVSYNGKTTASITIEPDHDYQFNLLNRCMVFMDLVKNKTKPEAEWAT